MDAGNHSGDLLTPKYRVAPEPFWAVGQWRGGDGYDRIEAARRRQWKAIPSWGRDGWDLGAWPLVVISHRDTAAGYDLAENCEGDVTVYRYPTRALRDAATDQIAFWHWHQSGVPWVAGIATHADAPAHLRGPYTSKYLEPPRPDRGLE